MQKTVPNPTPQWVLPPVTEGYTYFENCKDNPFRYTSQKFQMINAWWLADASLLAYADIDFAAPAFQRAGLTVDGNHLLRGSGASTTKCYVLYNDEMVVVAFRGTEIPREGHIHDSLKDWEIDATIPLVKDAQGGFVHRGFKESLDDMWLLLKSRLDRLRSEKPDRGFWFTGHSLGAALATLAAHRYGNARALYTFGSPLVGDSGFKAAFDQNGISTYRFVNHSDIVTRAPPFGPYDPPPPQVGDYEHVGQLKYIDSQGNILDDPGYWAIIRDGYLRDFDHVLNDLGHLRLDQIPKIPESHFTDHGPIFYSIKIWNNYDKDR